ncbi:Uncharacterised protein [Mycobacterium tuberculosis]|uniref:Uncharacterized protein n=1 Tax=Mycobacterium tuberculosis TaxID=1773 RepID=A0A654ZT16_MYCTX|nr:Uncharacterised protein [Mycobacterium tuberculosis]CKO82652.1 Uncharacterised protein [Mycobacterium tuberculosis]CKR04858.1 Uncharacterised protein [Mycobacterium tuberculosis]CKR05405.1 Uncharacterised protein [Mycobacterium tuberculosis]CKR62775.1 Uncharacterised protein [Mycobacterium tuberculosis]
MPSAHRCGATKGCNAGHFPAFGNILAVCDTHQTSLGHQGKLPVSLGSRGSRLDRRRDRDPVTTGQCVAVDSVDHQGSARIHQRLSVQLPRHQLRVVLRAGIAGRRVNGTQTHCLVGLAGKYGPGRRGQRRRDRSGRQHRRRELRGESRIRRACCGNRRSGAGLSGVLGQGPQGRAVSGGCGVACRRGGRNRGVLGSGRTVSGITSAGRAVGLRGQPGGRIRPRRSRSVHRQTARLPQRDLRVVRRVRVDRGCDRLVPISAR